MNRFFHILTLSILLTLPLCAQNGNWEVVGFTTRGLSGGQALVVDSVIYVVGGYSDSVQAAVDWIRTFEPTTGKYTLVGRMKKRRAFHSAVALGKKIYYAGGEYYNTREANGTIEVFDTETKTTVFLDSNKTFNRYLMASTLIDSSIYFIGGDPYQSSPHGGTNYPYIIQYSISEKRITYQYTAQFSNQNLREGQMIAVNGPNIYIFGGEYNTILSHIYRFNYETRQLIKLSSNLLIPRTNGRAFKLPNSLQVLIYGGFNESSFALSSVEQYTLVDSMSISARAMNPLNYRRRNFMSLHYKEALYIWGGTNEYGQFVKSIERLQMPTTSLNEDEISGPEGFILYQNYPNPFGASAGRNHDITNISFYLPAESSVSLRIYNILGEEVSAPVDGLHGAGYHTLQFDGSGLPAGIYFCRMIASPSDNSSGKTRFDKTNKMIIR
ncbi:MAG: hypothetical protein HUU54_10915 [Ignavibacteriaceae bacterium]|nr:hypothetical protein [Ignavibacteriaceae bacterium]